MTVHLLTAAHIKCVVCQADYDGAYPGPYFSDPRSWSLHTNRCDPLHIVVGTLDAPKLYPNGSDFNPYPRAGKPGKA